MTRTGPFILWLLLWQMSLVQSSVYRKNVVVFEIGGNTVIAGNRIEYVEPDCESGFECTTKKTCAQANTAPTLSADSKYFSCCRLGRRLLGSPETAFDCCAADQELVGAAHTGYRCCRQGQTYDGQACKGVCPAGKEWVEEEDGCVCAQGTEEADNGTCRPLKDEGPGLVSGHCYSFTSMGGGRLSLHAQVPDHQTHHVSSESPLDRFRLCVDEDCIPGQSVHLGDKFYMAAAAAAVTPDGSPARRRQWWNNAQNGSQIGRTTDFTAAGAFTLRQWSCGAYCLGGVRWGVGPFCSEAAESALSFYPGDPHMCVAVDLREVPCSGRSEDDDDDAAPAGKKKSKCRCGHDEL
ncbi:hypothetical protein P170DRAFT_489768 [Aspergillus steynii IBT 23096]|uniref:Cysteine-rich secreted protein n=1 Tax=Aspergillus steynii IBT 23096 TaxID=1392250 RepID=A0A2I2GJ30_9EURO|nr:uncharacterized protein P170DRAFT_489768 [Aspergillus steynii IBT 23096]PLB52878.1 hypothetical protein P170DRAFT_489768 [Aspergillus steynii IBT 23096]